MSGEAVILIEHLKSFGFNEDEGMVYLYLLAKERESALKISRELKIARTKVYRLLEKLIAKGLVKEEIKDYGTRFVAESYEKLNLIIDEKQQKLEDLKRNAPELFNQLANLQMNVSEETKVLYYRGIEGLKQVTWNTLKTKGLFRIMEINNMDAFLDRDFSEKVRAEFHKRNIKVHQLTNHTSIESYTNITEHIKDWTPKYIDPKILEINMEICIYNSVVAMYSYNEDKDDIFCVEIYNKKVADMQRQIFDFLWDSAAKAMKITSPNGKAEVIS